MAFVKGQSGNMNGRPKGGKSRYNRELARKLKESGHIDPLDLLIAVTEDESVALEIRIKAAQAAAPFIHRRKPQAMEITGKFEFLSAEDREMKRQLLLEEIRARAARRAAEPGSN